MNDSTFPGKDISFLCSVMQRWEPLLQKSLQGRDVSAEISSIDHLLERASADLKENRLPQGVDWEKDLFLAIDVHKRNQALAKINSERIDEWRQFWKGRLDISEKFAVQLAQEGLKYALAIHGAAAISFLNAIASDKASGIRRELVFGMVAAGVGVVAVSVSHIIVINHFSHRVGRLSGKLMNRKGWRALRAISRWQNTPRFSRIIGVAEWLMVGSIVWFVIYTLAFGALMYER